MSYKNVFIRFTKKFVNDYFIERKIETNWLVRIFKWIIKSKRNVPNIINISDAHIKKNIKLYYW
jgi:hypothetical protein